MPSVFISYSRRDKPFVERLHAALSERGYEVWVDWEDIPPSAEWFEEVRGGIRAADGVVYVISPDSASSEVCTTELEHAVVLHKRIVPVVCRDVEAAAVPESAAALNWVFIREADDFDAGVQTLVRALETDLEHVRTHTRLGVEAERWEASGRERSQLLRGAELTEAEAWLLAGGEKEPAPTQLQREYLHESREAATRRQRLVIGAVSLALVVAIGLGIFALIQANIANHDKNIANTQRRSAEAELDDTKAVLALGSDPQQSVGEALAAVRIAQNADTESGLREAVASAHLLRRFTFAGGSLDPDAVWSPNGRELLVVRPGVSARIYPLASGGRPISLTPPSTTGDVAWDAAGDRVIVGGRRTAVYDAASGALVATLPADALYVALSRDGSRALGVYLKVQGGADLIYDRVYDVASGALVSTFVPRDRAGVTCVAWAPNDSVIAQCDAASISESSATTDSDLDLWNPMTGRLVRSIATPYYIDSVAFSPDSSRYVYTLDSDDATGTIVADTRSGAVVKTFPGGALSAVFSPDGARLAYSSLSSGNLVWIYAFPQGGQRANQEPLVGATAAVDSVRFSADGSELVAASEDGIARVYDATFSGNAGEQLETLADGDVGSVKEASFGMDDTEIATTSDDGEVRLWSSPEPPLQASVTLTGSEVPSVGVGFTAAGNHVIEAGYRGGGEILDASDLRLLARFAAPAGYVFLGAGADLDGNVIAGLAERFTAAGAPAGEVLETYDGTTGRRLASVRFPATEIVSDAALNPDGTRLAASLLDGGAELLDARTGRLIATIPGSQPAIIAQYARSGSLFAVVHEPAPPPASEFTTQTVLGAVTIDLYDGLTGRRIRTLTGPHLTPLVPGNEKFAPIAIAFSDNANAIALVGADRNVWAWSTRRGGAGAALPIPKQQFGVSVAFSPNDQYVAVGGGAGAFVWDLKSGTPLPEFPQADPSQYAVGLRGAGVEVGFSNNSQVLVTAGDDVLKAWNITNQLQSQLQIFVVDAALGSLQRDGDEVVAERTLGDSVTGPERVSLYRCALCGGTSQLLALAADVPGAGN